MEFEVVFPVKTEPIVCYFISNLSFVKMKTKQTKLGAIAK